jgi:hypothetical protein
LPSRGFGVVFQDNVSFDGTIGETVERGPRDALLVRGGRYRPHYDRPFERERFINPGEDVTRAPEFQSATESCG